MLRRYSRRVSDELRKGEDVSSKGTRKEVNFKARRGGKLRRNEGTTKHKVKKRDGTDHGDECSKCKEVSSKVELSLQSRRHSRL
jgi:hypothetical protein